jgi:hypothetical protein
MRKTTDDRIPFDVASIVLQLVCWSVFFGLLIAAYVSLIQHSARPSTQELIDQMGYHQ